MPKVSNLWGGGVVSKNEKNIMKRINNLILYLKYG